MKTKYFPAIAHALLILNLFFGQEIFGQTVLTNPASPWIVPAGVTSIKVEVWGGGGGGGGGFLGAGGGGGGGAYNVSTIAVTPGHSFTITTGSGGTAGSTAAGGTGGTTTVTGTDGNVSATGGGGGGFTFGGNGGAGAASTGGLHNGGTGGASSGNGAGGGGGAGNNGNGVAGGNATTGTGGTGNPNAAPYIGGNGGVFITANGTGNPGAAPAGGGGGGRNTGFANNNGGAGGAGQVVITYTACPTINTTAGITAPICVALSINLTASNATGGTSPYTYSWTGPNSFTSTTQNPSISNATTAMNGSYIVTAKDQNGCTGTSNVVVTLNPQPSASAVFTNTSCFNGGDGTITVSGHNGTSPYSFSIDNGSHFNNAPSYQGGGKFGGLAPNTYKIMVMDNNGCTSRSVQ